MWKQLWKQGCPGSNKRLYGISTNDIGGELNDIAKGCPQALQDLAQILKHLACLRLGIAFASGVVADLLYGGVLGEQALRLVMLAFILQRFRARIRFFPMSQQMLAIGGLLFNDRIVSALVHIVVDEPTLPWSYWWAPLLGMGLWPLVFVLLDAVRFGKRGR